ncbi:hypothetical protein BS78_02G379300, partial [Paspalum vaginatum]
QSERHMPARAPTHALWVQARSATIHVQNRPARRAAHSPARRGTAQTRHGPTAAVPVPARHGACLAAAGPALASNSFGVHILCGPTLISFPSPASRQPPCLLLVSSRPALLRPRAARLCIGVRFAPAPLASAPAAASPPRRLPPRRRPARPVTPVSAPEVASPRAACLRVGSRLRSDGVGRLPPC